jgi:hypothetical protein
MVLVFDAIYFDLEAAKVYCFNQLLKGNICASVLSRQAIEAIFSSQNRKKELASLYSAPPCQLI